MVSGINLGHLGAGLCIFRCKIRFRGLFTPLTLLVRIHWLPVYALTLLKCTYTGSECTRFLAMIKYLCNCAAIWHLEMKLRDRLLHYSTGFFQICQKMVHSMELYFCWMRSLTTDSRDEMDCDGVIYR
jgi:hypothetical protein